MKGMTFRETVIILCLAGMLLFVGAAQMLSYGLGMLGRYVGRDDAARAFPLKIEMHEGLDDGFLTAWLFVQQIRGGAVQPAYDQTTSAFQDRYTLKDFKAFIAKSLPERPAQPKFNPADPKGPQIFTGSFLGADPEVSFTIKVSREDGGWKVDDFTIP